MLGRLRHKLRLMRYYSAPRKQTAWTRALDVALIASFFLAIPAVWISSIVATESRVALDVSGWLVIEALPGQVESAESKIQATIDEAVRKRMAKAHGAVDGDFRVVVTDRQQGWPLVTSIRRAP